MPAKYVNYEMTDKKALKELFEESISQNGDVRILGVLNHHRGETRYISLFVPVVRKGMAAMICIARERKVCGGGMDMGFHLAYRMYCGVYGFVDESRPYQTYLNFSWL